MQYMAHFDVIGIAVAHHGGSIVSWSECLGGTLRVGCRLAAHSTTELITSAEIDTERMREGLQERNLEA